MASPSVLGIILFIATFFQFASCQNDLRITSVTSPTSSQLSVTWTSSSNLVAYFMIDLRVVGNANIAPVSVITLLSTRSKVVQGLRAGTQYNVTVKSFQSNSVVLASTWSQSLTVPATPQIVQANGISSTQISVGWSPQTGTDYYFLRVSLGPDTTNQTFNSLSGNVIGLRPTTLYSLTLYALNSAGSSTASKSMTALTLTPPPTAITVTPLSSYTMAMSWQGVDKALMYGILIYKNGDVNSSPAIRKTTSTSIILDNLLPCTKYIFGLTSYNWFYTAGEENRVQQETGKVDSVQGITFKYTNNLLPAVISWTAIRDATSYTATAESQGGDILSCASSSTSCDLIGLVCEQQYKVTVVAKTDSCTSDVAYYLTLNTAPCAPENITVTRDCTINVVYLSWNPISDALEYTANAVAADGSKEYCSNHETTCFFMNLLCGTQYELTVYAFDGMRNGSSSLPVTVNTSPCDPEDAQAIPDCQDSILTVSWTESAGAFSYAAMALGSSGTIYNCTSFRTSCAITDMQCGESLSVSVVAYDDECSSDKSTTNEVVSAPCTPQNINVLTDCERTTALVTWGFTMGAVMYIVDVEGSDGTHHVCQSADVSCTLTDLACGEVYSLSIIATNYNCNSTPSAIQQFQTVPCTPSYIRSELNCNHNNIMVTWQEGMGNLTYRADAQENGDFVSNCLTENNYCEITDINCGQIYTVIVSANNGVCTSPTNETLPFYSVPCPPTNVQAVLDCLNGNISVTWTPSQGVGALMYVATVESGNQQNISCNSDQDSCVISNFQCGVPFTVSVIAIGNDCQSLKSQEVNINPVPCIPQNVTAYLANGSNTVVIAWNSSPGASQYLSALVADNGKLDSCSTANTTCNINGLQCGHVYELTVSALHDQCPSAASEAVLIETGPCTPENVIAVVDANITLLSWSRSLGAVGYISTVIGPAGEIYSCNTMEPMCNISGLECGKTYSASVIAYDAKHHSAASVSEQFQTVPCIPIHVQAQLDVGANTVQLSWDSANGAVNYAATVTGPNGAVYSCNATGTTCSIGGLQCGQTYQVVVIALNETHTSEPSAPVNFKTAPCPPQILDAQFDSNGNIATVSWNATSGALNYLATLTGPGGEHYTCNATGTNCSITPLQCGQTYNASIQAVNEYSVSKPSATVKVETAPCTPQTVLTGIDCGTNIATLSWASTPGALMYSATVTADDGKQRSCNATKTNCTFSGLACGQTYSATVTAFNRLFQSAASAAAQLHTVPCISTNVASWVDCSTNVATLFWDAAPGALSYISSLTEAGGEKYTCVTTSTNCSISGMKCGQHYTASVQALNDACSSTSTAKDELQTAPCASQNVAAVLNCGTKIATVIWDNAPGALSYSSTATGPNGDVHSCNTTATDCDIDGLQCGQTYSVTVTAFGSSCSAPASTAVQLYNAPCIPGNVQTLLDCGTNMATMQWQPAVGAVSYLSTLTGTDRDVHTCATNATTCNIPGLQCGTTYTGTVTAINEHCDNVVSASVELQTVPCIPTNLGSLLSCTAGTETLVWDAAPGAANYTSFVTGPNGEQHSCSTSDTTCTINDLQCGQVYGVNIKALGGHCSSQASPTADFQTAPCEPQGLQVQLDCHSGTAVISWSAALGALSYTSHVRGPDGKELSCNSTSTTCSIEGLACGTQYNTSVTAYNHLCSGIASASKQFQTAPCVANNLQVQLDCATNTATLSWVQAAGAESYQASVTAAGEDQHSCNTTHATCEISNLQCGLTYTATVTTRSAGCTSAVSPPATFESAPCVPQEVNSAIDCELNAATLSWGSTRGALSYVASVNGSGGFHRNCSTVSTTCVIPGLQCGQAYTVTISAFSTKCSSAPSAVIALQAVSCIPTYVGTQLECEHNIATVSWENTAGAVSYISTLTGPDGEQHSCNATGTTCSISGLLCGQTYTTTLEALSEACSQSANVLPELNTAPCQSYNLEAQLTCGTNITTLSWDAALGAVSYISYVTGPNEEGFSCSTASTTCDFVGLACGTEYSANVTAFNDQCGGVTSMTKLFRTAPCIPQNVAAVLSCETNIATVSWDAAPGAESYVSNVTGPNGVEGSCNTTGTSCEMTALQCGQTYTFTVAAIGETCSQSPSETVQLETAPCTPSNVETLIDCDSNTATMSWTSTQGAVNYTSTLTRSGEEPHSCSSRSTACDISGLQCGQTYTVTVTAFSEECRGAASLATEFQTVPCTPTNVATQLDCGSNNAFLSWESAAGAVNYRSSVMDLGGNVEASCMTAGNNCNVNGLSCGQTYNVTVRAISEQCSSAPSAAAELISAPCIPSIAEMNLDCETNTMTLVWDATPGALNYTSTVSGPDGELTSCNTTDISCDIRDLQCGQTYNATLSAFNEQCNSPAPPLQFQTAPCSPVNVQTHLNCDTNIATLSWASAPGAESYTSNVTGGDGQQHTCNVTGNSCSISSLQCGQNYTATVKALSTACSSPASVEAEFQTVPCVPTSVTAQLHCALNTATLSWDAAPGAVHYTSSVSGATGEVHSCNSTDRACSISDLECGQMYAVTVSAHSEACTSASSQPAQLQTVPCIPSNFNAGMDCKTNTATLSWGYTPGAESYTSSMTGPDGDSHTCSTGVTSCSVSALQCGQTYTTVVTATSANCSSKASLTAAIQTAPCIPQTVTSVVDCSTNTASVQWTPTTGAESYMAVASDSDGHIATCNTTGSTCQIAGLQCGQNYNVAVIAAHTSCQAVPSASVAAETAPCPPKNVIPTLDLSNSLTVTWLPSDRADSYTVTAEGSFGFGQTCTTTSTTCDLLFLDCETTFNVTVTASGGVCQSPPSNAVSVTTGPCLSSIINSSLACNNNSASFWWNQRYTATSYTVTAEGGNASKSCDTADLSCTIPDLPCGQLYNVTWEAYDAQFGVVEVTNTKIQSAPCPPTNLVVEMACPTNIATVWWMHVGDMLSYSATASATDGHMVSCNSTQTSCEMSDLECGQTYSVVVKVIGVQCQSASSEAYLIDTAPCPPTNVHGEVDCSLNYVSATWDQNDRADNYLVTVRDSTGDRATCSTTNTSCDTVRLLCGRKYNLTVTALQGDCSSSNSNSVEIESVPCTPENVGSQDSCGSDVIIHWHSSDGAESYTVTAQQSNGNLTSCSTAGTSCSLVGLACGESYQTTVQASSGTCDSPLSSALEFYTVPCIPQHVAGYVKCNNGFATLFWESTPGALLYTATAILEDGTTTSCNSANTSCDIAGLHCGQTYEIAVIAKNENCTSIASSFYEIKTAPCTPEGVVVHHDCATNIAVVSWAQSDGAMNYTVMALSVDALVSWCNTTGLTCNLVDLACGWNYSITVHASNSECDSLPSLDYQLETAPCMPINVQTNLHCGSHNISVLWDATRGVKQYTVTATTDNDTASCTSTNTACNFQDLLCGQEYRITVVGSSGRCNGSGSSPAYQKTVPCAPHLLQTYASYETSSVIVSWERTANAKSYTATAVGVGTASCTTSNTTCTIQGLQCGQNYTVTVQGNDGLCDGIVSPEVGIRTVPCIPVNVQSTVICDTNSMLVSWASSDGASAYAATAVGIGGDIITLTTNATNCKITALKCGESYNVTVVAIHEDYTSSTSAAVVTRAVPCTPDNLHAEVQCENSTILATWNTVSGAASYVATAVGKDGVPVSCNTTESHCTLSGLACGNNYTITVRASDVACQSVQSNTTYFHTEPCQPKIVLADYVLGTASVTWQTCAGATSYTATVEGRNGHIATCITTEIFCDIPNLLCGQIYTAYITAKNEKCNITSNYTKEIVTAPCSPQNLSVILIHDGVAAHVTWEPSEGALLYTVIAEGSTDSSPHSCQTEDTVCEIGILLCGNKYTFTLTAVGAKSNTTADASFSLETAPCPPTNFLAEVHCDSNSVSASWQGSDGATFYTVLAEGPGGGNISCNTTSTSCELLDLPCGMACNLSVVAGAGTSQSSPSNMELIKTGPCDPQYVAATVHCDMNIASISWDSSAGAESYIAFATGHDVNVHSCNTTDTFCDIVGLDCGEVYNITVTALDKVCRSVPSASTEVTTAPCAPGIAHAHINCDADMIVVSWGPGRGAESYQVIAKGQGGDAHSCSTTDTQCDISGLLCGTYYSLTVIAENFLCNASSDSAGLLQTAPCVPEHVKGEFDCSTNEALVSWSESVRGASYYRATAKDQFGNMVTCTTPLDSCHIPYLQCGLEYSFSVQAANGQCNASLTFSNQTRAAPCPPQDVSAVLECATNNAFVSWLPSGGALAYTVIATGNGNSSTCNTTFTNCTFSGLQCGTQYSVTVVAVDDKCNSVASSTSDFQTAPCTPVVIETFIDCENSSAFVIWEYSLGAHLYEVTVDSNDGHTLTYSTVNTSSEFLGLSCGETFSVAVMATDGVCNSSQSQSYLMQTAPCSPDIVEALTNCDSGTTSLSWNQTKGAESYILTATAENGHVVFYETTHLSYSITDLHCGLLYSISVAGVSQQCNSSQSSAAEVQGVPCIPESLQAYFDCSQGVVELSWEQANRASIYTATAYGNVGYPSGCSTSNTTCTITDLACGHMYDITVVAENNICSSEGSAPVTVKTASCALQNVETLVDCSTNLGLVSWDISDGAHFYEVTSVSINGDTESCSTTDTNCTLRNLHCGLTYNVTTAAIDGICNDTVSVTALKTVPCPPENVLAVSECDTGIVTVSWDASNGAISYNAIAKSVDGSIGSCNTTGMSCAIPNLLCGHTYLVTVTGLDENCQGEESSSYEMHTVPCIPTSVSATMECDENTLSVSWDPADNSVSYLVEAVRVDGFKHTCTTKTTACSLADLPCGQSYAVAVTAVSDRCNSETSSGILVKAGPCVPEDVAFLLDCDTNIVSVTWATSSGASEYHVIATATDEQGSSCNSTSAICILDDLQCGLTYMVAVYARDDTCATNLSSLLYIETVPCVPENCQVQMECMNNSAVFTWDQSRGGQSYLAFATGDDNYSHMCDTGGRNCSVGELTCGTVYSFSVAASNGVCNSSSTVPVISGLVPCPPELVETSIYHRAVKPQEVEVSWGESHCGVDYMATVQGEVENDPESHFILNSYWTTYPDFYIATPCSSAYNVTVTARNSAGLSDPTVPISGFTAPCPPQVNAVAVTGATMLISWQPSLYAAEYRVRDASSNNTICSTSSLSCNIPITSHVLEVTAVNSSGESEASRVAGPGSAK